MKRSIAIIILFFTCSIALAQTSGQPGDNINVRICTPSRGSVLLPPLYVVFKGDKVIYKTNAGIPNVQPGDIESINVLKNNSAAEKYGPKGAYGVVEIRMKKGTKLDTNKIRPDTNKIKLNTDTGKAIRIRGGK